MPNLFEVPESVETQNQARAELIALRPKYQAGIEARAKTKGKTFTGVGGPFGVGKSTNTDEAIRLEPSIKHILTTTTRPGKPEDPAGFKTADTGITFTSMLEAARNQELVNFSPIPGGHVYGTYPEDFPGIHNIGPFLPSSIDHISQAGFEQYTFVYLVAAGELWKNFVLATRQDLPSNVYRSRINEADDSIEFATQNIDSLAFVENLPEQKGEYPAAKVIAQLALGRPAETLSKKIARQRLNEMRAALEELK